MTNWEQWFSEHMKEGSSAFAVRRWTYNLPLLRCILQHSKPEGSILECGSGTGTMLSLLAAMGYRCVGVDISQQMLRLAQSFADTMGSAARVEFLTADTLSLPFETGRFDLAFSCGLHEHFTEEECERSLREMGRVARQVLVVVPSYWVWKRERAEFDGAFYPLTMRSLRRRFKSAGFQVIDELAYCAANKLGRAIELGLPPFLQKSVFPYFASTIGLLGAPTASPTMPDK